MSQSLASPTGVTWGLAAAAQQHQHQTFTTQGGHNRNDLRSAYNKVVGVLDSATATIKGIASGLQDAAGNQGEVSARVVGQPARCTGRKRKLSPCVYDYSDGGFGSSSKADTPTQELLPASRSELRSHQLTAVKWLAALERQGASGILADEAEADRRAAVCGLLSHLCSTPPVPLPAPPHGPAAAGPHGPQGPGAPPHAVLLLAPGGSLPGWTAAIREHVDVELLLNDGSDAFAGALRTAAAGPSTSPHATSALGPIGLTPSRRIIPSGPTGGGATSAAGVYGPQLCRPSNLNPTPPHNHTRMLGMTCRPLVVLSPLEQLQRDVGLLSSLPQRVLVVDLAPRPGGSGGSARTSDGGMGSGGGAVCGSADRAEPFLARCAFGGGSGSGCRPGAPEEDAGRACRGMDLEGQPALHLLCRMPAGSRVLLSAGEPEAEPGESIWLLLQLLAPQVRHPLWQAISEVQQALLAPENVQYKESLLAQLHGRLWELLRPLQLHRAARDFDLATMRAAHTNLNLFDHFSAARNDGTL